MSRILITGASGFIGKAMCRYFCEQGHSVYALVRKYCRELPEEVSQILADMSEYDRLNEIITFTPDVAVLLAWNGTRGGDRNDAAIQEANVSANLHCLRSLIDLGCKTVAFAGSQAEYGPRTGDQPMIETDPPAPNTSYGQAKLQFSNLATGLCADAQVRYLEPRIFSLYGEGDFQGTLTMSLLKKMLAGYPCELTECIQLWDYLYIDDAVKYIAALIENKAAEGIYNIASGDVRPLKDYVMQMYSVSGSASKLLFGAMPYPPGGIVNINPSVAKLHNIVGNLQSVPFEEGIRRIICSIR